VAVAIATARGATTFMTIATSNPAIGVIHVESEHFFVYLCH
jgi:hypothetical protein